ncbi:MAG TPA: hypothetical protein VG651_08520 [Stellaceae bacterium]|nr:hypothetical protein [Stellaceae bacterium]
MADPAREDLAFVLRLLNQALDRVQGHSRPVALLGWRKDVFGDLKWVLDRAKAIQRDRDA